VRAFIVWTGRQKITGPLTAIAPATKRHADPLETRQRVQLIHTLLTDESLDLRDRVAGSLVLLLAQQISRVVLLSTDDVQQREARVFLSRGRGPLLLPEPLATLTEQLRATPPSVAARTVSAGSQWLFPGRLPGSHLSEDHLRERLRKLDIQSLPARNAAALNLGQALPAAILADLIGFARTPPSAGPSSPTATGHATQPHAQQGRDQACNLARASASGHHRPGANAKAPAPRGGNAGRR